MEISLLEFRLFLNGVAAVIRKRSLILAVAVSKSGAEAAVNSKLKSNPPIGSMDVVVRMPGLFPGETMPLPSMEGTLPLPESTADESSVRDEELAILPDTIKSPSCAQVEPV